ncbi:hypothetical protein N9O11_01920 [Flavobacteriaceae bacterium]|nr:hypothetical protein [Flavobacteriaceae bacterium]MDA9176904.1 hypothetical protein [Flavobacteriaceae bacterium]
MTYILIFAGLFLLFIIGVYFQGSKDSQIEDEEAYVKRNYPHLNKKESLSREVRNAELKDIGIISHYKGKPFTGTTVEKDGSKCDYVEGLKHGLDITFSGGYDCRGLKNRDVFLFSKVNYVNDQAKGSVEFFGVNGSLIAKGEFDIKTTGTWKYYQNGKLFKIEENPQLDLEEFINKRVHPLQLREESFQMFFSGDNALSISKGDVVQSKTSNKFYLLNAEEKAVFDFISGIAIYFKEIFKKDIKEMGLPLNERDLKDIGLALSKNNGTAEINTRYRALSWFEDSNPELFKKLFDLNDTASKAIERAVEKSVENSGDGLELGMKLKERSLAKSELKKFTSHLLNIPIHKFEFKTEQHSKYMPNSEKSMNPIPKWYKTIDVSEIDVNDLSDGMFNNEEEYLVYNFLNEIKTHIDEGNLDFNDLLKHSNYSEIKEARETCLNWLNEHNNELYEEFKEHIIKSEEKDDDLISEKEDQDSVQELESLSLDSRSMHAFDVFKSRNPGLEKICNKELTKIWDDFFLWCYAQNAFIMRRSGAEEAIRSYSNYDLKITPLMQEALDEIGSQWERNSIDHQTEAEEECRNECGEEDCEWPDFNPDCESCGGLGYFQYDHWKSYELTIQNIIKGIDKNNFHKLSQIKFLEIQDVKPNVEEIKKFYDNGNIKQIYTLKDSEYDGKMKLYHENGQLKVELNWTDGRQDNEEVTSFHPNGKIARKVNISNHKLNGQFTEWHDNGKIKTEGYYIDRTCYIEKEWWDNGNLKSEISYKNNEKIQENNWDENGNKI